MYLACLNMMKLYILSIFLISYLIELCMYEVLNYFIVEISAVLGNLGNYHTN